MCSYLLQQERRDVLRFADSFWTFASGGRIGLLCMHKTLRERQTGFAVEEESSDDTAHQSALNRADSRHTVDCMTRRNWNTHRLAMARNILHGIEQRGSSATILLVVSGDHHFDM